MKIGQRYNPTKLFCGIYVPNFVWQDKILTPLSKLLFGRLVSYAGKNGVCFPKQETLAEEFGVSTNTILTSINQLVAQEYLEKEHPTGKDRLMHKCIKYHFIWHESCDESLMSGPNENIRSEPNENIRCKVIDSCLIDSSLKTICSEKDSEQLNQQDDSVGVISRKRKPSTKTITMEVPDLEEKNEYYLPYVQRLAQIVFSTPGAMRSKQKVQLDAARTKQWVNEIRLLCDKDGVTTNKLSRVLDWYADHIGGEYIPVVKSGSSLREKWPNLLAAIERGKSKPKSSGSKPSLAFTASPENLSGYKKLSDQARERALNGREKQ